MDNKLLDTFNDLLKSTSLSLKDLRSECEKTIYENIDNIEDDKQREYLKGSIKGVFNGDIKPDELLKNIKNL